MIEKCKCFITHLLGKDVQGVMVAGCLRLQLVLPLVLPVHHRWVVCICCQGTLQQTLVESTSASRKGVQAAAGVRLWQPCKAKHKAVMHAAVY